MTNATNRPTGRSSNQEGFPMERELIVIAKREAGLRVTREGIASVEGADVNSLADVLASESAVMRPLFGTSEEQIQARTVSVAGETDADVPDLSIYYRVEAPDERLEELAARLREQEVVEAAYVKPPAELPIALDQVSEMFNDMVPLAEEAPPISPDFTVRQAYLDAAPGGIDARYAWTQSGSGAGVGIIDIEGAWRFTHEDLTQNQGGVIGGTQSTDLGWRNHGTAVVGEFGSDRNTFGCTGICPDANVRAISIFGGLGSAGAIRQAADMLNPGDIILIELHREGPRSTGIGQQGYIAIEWWPDDFDAIRYATSRGVIVVEAAGNGAENLDDPIYNTPAQGFPSNWTNPFNRSNRDSGAIFVGAGAPPPNTHGRDHGPDRSRLDFSNYGLLIDAQGWGREVTTCGYGDLQGGSNEDFWYTDQFSGTSSASPIVVGALTCLQSILLTRGRSPVFPSVARNLLRSTGSPQQDAPGRPRNQRIGNRPNIREMLVGVIDSNIFQKIDGNLKQISAGSASHIWGVNANDEIFQRVNNVWQKISGALKHVSVGADGTVWGVNANNDIFRYLGNNQWQQIDGSLKQISVGSASYIWGVNANDEIFQRVNNVWQKISGALKQVSVGADGTLWGVNASNDIFMS